jgi:hypothetical protein
MKEYFYASGGQKYGPFSLEELKTKPIHPQSLIWYKGLENWKKAVDFPELKDKFRVHTSTSSADSAMGNDNPPPMPNQNQAQQASGMGGNHFQRLPKTWVVESILATLFCCFPFGIAGIINASNVESRFSAGDVAGAERASKEAGKWTKVALFCGLGIGVLYIIYFVVLGATVFSNAAAY